MRVSAKVGKHIHAGILDSRSYTHDLVRGGIVGLTDIRHGSEVSLTTLKEIADTHLGAEIADVRVSHGVKVSNSFPCAAHVVNDDGIKVLCGKPAI